MRVRLDDGRIVKMLHFRYCRPHLDILNLIQAQVENLQLVAVHVVGGESKVLTIPAYKIRLDNERELRMLNPPLE